MREEDGLFTTPPVIVGTGCSGCGIVMAVQIAMPVLGERTVVAAPASCLATIGASPARSSWKVPFIHSLFESAPALTSGLKAAYEALGKENIAVVTFAGDSGTLDIGFQALSAQAARDDDVIHICCDNEVAMNTGGQANMASPYGAVTLTTPSGAPHSKKDGPAIMAAHGIPYVATAAVSHAEDLAEKVRRAKDISGMRYLHVITPCPLAWRYEPEETVEISRLAVESGLWMLYEVVQGARRITYVPKKPRPPVRDYFRRQGRFEALGDEEVERLQRQVDEAWEEAGGTG